MEELNIIYQAARVARLTAEEHRAVDNAVQKLAQELSPKTKDLPEKENKKKK